MFRALLDSCRKPSAEALAQRELDDTKRDLVVSQRTRDYYAKMVEFHEMRIARLTRMIRGNTPPNDTQ